MRLEFTVPGKPVSKNGTYERRGGKGRGLRLTDAAQDFWARVQFAAIGAVGHERCLLERNVAVVVTAHFTRPADSGASIALVKDALQGIVYVNDKVVVFEASWQGLPDRENPRTEVQVWEFDASEMTVHCQIPCGAAVDFSDQTKDARKAAVAFKHRSRLVSSARDYRGTSAWEDAHRPLPLPGRYPDGM